jgi:hypothetical protein
MPRPRRIDIGLRSTVLSLYRQCLRLTGRLQFEHQDTWYDYIKLSFRQNREIQDPSKIKQLISDTRDQIEFTEKMLKSKNR